MKQEITKIERPKGWISNFTLIGKVKPTDKTFKIDQHKEGSDWIYNAMNLGVDCGDKCGFVFADLMGGYREDDNSVIYAHGKKEDGIDDYQDQIIVNWDDRFNDDVIESCGNNCFITVGLEKQKDGKTFYKKFLAEYDAIAYIKDNLPEDADTIVKVKGRLKYSTYNGTTQVKKEISSIWITDVEPEKFTATFTQSMLINKDSCSIKDIDKTTGTLVINATVLDYIKEVNGVEYKGQFPYIYPFEFDFNLKEKDKVKLIYEKLFKAGKKYNFITFIGHFIESGAVIMPTVEDIPDDIMEFVNLGVMTEDEALQQCADNGKKVKRMVLRMPRIIKDSEGNSIIQRENEIFTEEDLEINIETVEEEIEDINNADDVSAELDDDMAWLNELDD